MHQLANGVAGDVVDNMPGVVRALQHVEELLHHMKLHRLSAMATTPPKFTAGEA
jgi:hypothetical protein